MEFKQLEAGAGLADIQVTCTKIEAEDFIERLIDVEATESDSFTNVADALEVSQNKDDKIIFVISGDSAAEDGELIPELEQYLEDLNEKQIAEFEAENE